MNGLRQRNPRMRLPKLLKAANGAPCAICGEIGTTVAAHSNALRHGHGIGVKPHDFYTAYVCQDHHDMIDGRKGKLTLSEKREMWELAWERTVAYWFENGIVVLDNNP